MNEIQRYGDQACYSEPFLTDRSKAILCVFGAIVAAVALALLIAFVPKALEFMANHHYSSWQIDTFKGVAIGIGVGCIAAIAAGVFGAVCHGKSHKISRESYQSLINYDEDYD